MKETYRLRKIDINNGYDLVFVARVRMNQADYRTVEKSMFHLLKKSEGIKMKKILISVILIYSKIYLTFKIAKLSVLSDMFSIFS